MEEEDPYDSFEFSMDLLRGVYRYAPHPTKEQVFYLKNILSKKNIVSSKNFFGKTTTLAIGMLHMIDSEVKSTQALILSSSQEESENICKYIKEIAFRMPNITVKCFNDSEGDKEIECPLIVVCTPEKALELITNGSIKMESLKMLGTDSGESIVQKNVIEVTKSIFEKVSKDTQIIIFSSNLPWAFNKISKFINDPFKECPEPENFSIDDSKHFYIKIYKGIIENTEKEDKIEFIKNTNQRNVILFVDSKSSAENIKSQIEDVYSVFIIHEDSTKEERHSILNDFLMGRSFSILIVTEYVQNLIIPCKNPIIINFELPVNKERYISHIKKCTVFDKRCAVISLTSKPKEDIKDLEKELGTVIPAATEDVFDIIREYYSKF